MPLLRHSPRRLGLLGLCAATAFVASCDTTVGFRPNELLWGFVSLSAVKNPAGETRTAPTGTFFRGEVSSLPSAAVRPDTCFPSRTYVPPTNSFAGVAFLDAGASISLNIGGTTTEVPRISGGGITKYNLAAGTTVAYRPGDSIVVRVPGANGGYPTTEVRGKTAEAFTMQPVTPPASGYMQLRWTAASDNNSALVLSLQYAPAGGGSTVSREILCAFADDGVDSIPVAKYQEWSAASNVTRQVVANRLRTVLQNVNGGAIQFISTYQLPTPTP
ncbi:MAG: hypothetical protein IT361_08510 [Gemmatimonadaceae bacterium]|nr:hypothetical protein [Gemmatimonadaceae bacterium]